MQASYKLLLNTATCTKDGTGSGSAPFWHLPGLSGLLFAMGGALSTSEAAASVLENSGVLNEALPFSSPFFSPLGRGKMAKLRKENKLASYLPEAEMAEVVAMVWPSLLSLKASSPRLPLGISKYLQIQHHATMPFQNSQNSQNLKGAKEPWKTQPFSLAL